MSSSSVVAPVENPPGMQSEASPATKHLRLLSYNIQVAVASTRFRHYLTQSWKHILPHPNSFTNLDRIGEITRQYDVVALQEVDAGSLRSQFINQVEYLAERGSFPYWYYQTNRNLGKFAQASNGLLSHIAPDSVEEHKLPGFIPGRGAIFVRFGSGAEPLVLVLAHLALSKRARLMQLAYIAELTNSFPHVVLMGDLNCQPHSYELRTLLRTTNLCPPLAVDTTFPSWRPTRKLDYILVTPTLRVISTSVIPHAASDHLPVAVDIALPDSVNISKFSRSEPEMVPALEAG